MLCSSKGDGCGECKSRDEMAWSKLWILLRVFGFMVLAVLPDAILDLSTSQWAQWEELCCPLASLSLCIGGLKRMTLPSGIEIFNLERSWFCCLNFHSGSAI